MRRRILAALAGVFAAAVVLWALRPGPAVRVEIPEHLSARQTAELLKERRVVVSEIIFRGLLTLTRFDRKLKPGTYTLRVRERLDVLVRKLTLGLTDDVRVTVPEGWRASQIAKKFAAEGLVDAREFEEYVARHKLEGRLFPSTYRFPPGYGAERAAQRMLEEFRKRAEPLYSAPHPNVELPFDQILTLASIVERESSLSAERPMIAAVYLNRLRRKMKLQSVPTVQYALGYWKEGFDSSEVEIDSPYNTYRHYGLPPGPICNPGLDSIRAVLSPATSDALYMMADGKGGNVFSATNEQHVRNRRRYEKVLRAKKRESVSGAAPAR